MAPRNGRIIAIVAAGVLLAGSAVGQGKGASVPPPSSGSGIGTSTGTTGSRGTTPSGTTPTNPNSSTASPSTPRPIYLSGRVVTDDGAPLPEAATIVRVCGGSSHNEGYTDSTGNFSVQLFNEVGVMQDASETSTYGSSGVNQGAGGGSGTGGSQSSNTGSNIGMMDRRLNNCELKASLSGFRSQSVVLAALQPTMGPTDVGTIMLHRTNKGEEDGNTVSAVSLAAPKDARKAFQKGQDLVRKQKVDDAFHEYEKAVMLYPAYATAWCELGKIEAAHQQVDIARGSFKQAIKADPKYVEPYLELSRIVMDARNWNELAQLTGKAIELNSFDYPQAFLFDAVAHYNLHEFELAEKSVRRAENLDTRHEFPQILYLKGMVQVQHQDYAGAIENLRAYLKLSPDAEDAPKVREQLARAQQYVSQSAAKKRQQPE